MLRSSRYEFASAEQSAAHKTVISQLGHWRILELETEDHTETEGLSSPTPHPSCFLLPSFSPSTSLLLTYPPPSPINESEERFLSFPVGSPRRQRIIYHFDC